MTTTTRRQFIKLSVAATAAVNIQNTFAEDQNSQRLHLFLSERILNVHSGGCGDREFDKLATGSVTHFY